MLKTAPHGTASLHVMYKKYKRLVPPLLSIISFSVINSVCNEC